jgi:catalase
VPTVVRFANGNGNPDVHDGVPNVRSMAVKFQLAGGKSADILANSVEGFVARTPEELLEFLRAQLPAPATGRPDPDAVPRFLAGHPAGRGFVERLMKRPVPASYGQTTYFAEHAFRFTAADNTSRFGRYRFVPQAGEAFLSPDDAGKRSPSFLREELEGRLRTGPVAFRLLLQVAEAGDPTDDVTALWPEDRPLVELGRLEVTGVSPTSAADERRLIFDPTNRTQGIDLSADPILLARSAAYAISYDRRSKGE